MTPSKLKNYTCKDLAQMARQQGVTGWHSMRKDQLIRALISTARKGASKKLHGGKPTGSASKSAGAGSTRSSSRNGSTTHGVNGSRSEKRLNQLRRKLETAKNLASPTANQTEGDSAADRLVVMVRDPYWLHAYWELSQRSVSRAQVAMGQKWHTSVPVLRLQEVAEEGVSTFLRDIQIHGGVNNWYLDVDHPPCNFRIEIGYKSADGDFYSLARSNEVATPPAGRSDAIDENWVDVAENADRIFAMSGGYSPHGASQQLQELLEERLRRPLGSPMKTRFGVGVATVQDEGLQLAVDAELIVYGATQHDAHVTLNGEPVDLREDGTFTVKLNMPDKRQVIPIVASTSEGMEQRTVILAVERNTKTMEPVLRDRDG